MDAQASVYFSPLTRERISFEIVTQITDAIAQGSMAPGSKLPAEPQLMAQLGVGRNALREAIKILEAFGLVVIRRGAGTFIQDSCTFDLLAPLFLELLWSDPSKKELTDALESLRHAHLAFDSQPQHERDDGNLIFLQLCTLIVFLFRRYDPPLIREGFPSTPEVWAGKKQPASRQIFWQMVQDIADRTLHPGDKLATEPELMARFSVSRNVVREAVKALEAIGLLEIRRPEGTFVSPHSPSPAVPLDPVIYGRILAHQDIRQFLRLKISLRDALFYLSCKNASLEEQIAFHELSQTFSRLLLAPEPQLAPCASALDEINHRLSQICANPILQHTEHIVLGISAQSRNNFLVSAFHQGRQREVAHSYLQDADILLRRDLAAIPPAMEKKLELWTSLEATE